MHYFHKSFIIETSQSWKTKFYFMHGDIHFKYIYPLYINILMYYINMFRLSQILIPQINVAPNIDNNNDK